MKNSFIVYTDNTEYMDVLSDEQVGQLYRAQIAYAKGEDVDIPDLTVKALFMLMKGQMDRDNEKYQKKVESVNRARESRSTENNTDNSEISMKSECNQSENNSDTVTVTDTVTVIPNGIKRERRASFVEPTLYEVRAYCRERKNKVDPEAFVAFYESNGWKVGRNKMSDWKAAVRTWEQREKSVVLRPPAQKPNKFHNFPEREESMNDRVTADFNKLMEAVT